MGQQYLSYFTWEKDVEILNIYEATAILILFCVHQGTKYD